jgi:hypothetical protein
MGSSRIYQWESLLLCQWESLLHNEHGDAARPTDNAQMTKFGAIPDAD